MWGFSMSKRPNQATSIIEGDQVVIFRGNCTDYRVVPMNVLVDEIVKELIDREIIPPIVE